MAVKHKIRAYDDGQIIVIKVGKFPTDNELVSDFPHPLLTVDYHKPTMDIRQFVLARSIVKDCMKEYGRWLTEGSGDTPTLLRYFTDVLDKRTEKVK